MNTMPEQVELECVSCETSFEPAPNGGFCPDCDTPHPDYEPQDDESDEAADDEEVAEESGDSIEEWAGDEEADEEAEEADDAAEVSCGSCGEAVDPDAAFCPHCGAEIGAEEEEEDESDEPELSACPDCGTSIDDEAFCPNCGTHLDPIRAGEEPSDDADAPEEVTLVVAGERYTFGDGDTFGRQDATWLDDLVQACGGREAVTYVSGEHLEFSVEDDGFYVTDISTNGTKRNGTDLDGRSEKLEDGDVLELADRAEIEVEL